ncbi:hypothetical protein TNCV_3437371 [Trichonephila clavipes]|nr:hypothetical protein TNCV_3437371 [Trichonephila clavipes]
MSKGALEHRVLRMDTQYPVRIWLMATVECMAGPRASTPERCSASCSTGNAYKRGDALKSIATLNLEPECRISVAMHNATAQQPFTKVSANSHSTIVMLQAEAGSISKHNVIPFRCPCPPFIAPFGRKPLWFPVNVKKQ